jgi:glyoxylase-like metal-dependent hydrolase (beta-lactamase superfamily II)
VQVPLNHPGPVVAWKVAATGVEWIEGTGIALRRDEKRASNTWLVGGVLFEPYVGPGMRAAWIEYLDRNPPRAVAVTHWHPDHANGAIAISHYCRAPLYGPSSGRAEGDPVEVLHELPGWLSMPADGHDAHQVCWYEPARRVLVGGDLIDGDGGELVEVGRDAAHDASLRRAIDLAPQILLPGHGRLIPNAVATLEAALRRRVRA